MRPKYIVTALALVSFALPIGLRAVGVTAHEFENHALAPAPKLSQGWDVFPQTTQFFTDRMPLREQAVIANRRISGSIFGTDPAYRARQLPGAPVVDSAPNANIVTRGRSGWLFSTESLKNSCKANRPVTIAQANHAWGRLRAELLKRARRVLIVVVPDKDTIYPELLPGSFAEKDCLPQDRDELWHGLETAGPGFLPLRSALTAAKQQNRQPIYTPKDTHWNGIGASYFAREVLKTLGGNVQMQNRDLQAGLRPSVGDLGATLGPGEVQLTQVPTITVRRAKNAQSVPGRTVLIGDSFSSFVTQNMQAYFGDYARIDWNTVQTIGNARSTAATARAAGDADTVILEVAERHYLQMAEPIGTQPRPGEFVVSKVDYLTAALASQTRR